MNRMKYMFAKIVTFCFGGLFSLLNRLTKDKFYAKAHYYTMSFFKSIFKNYYLILNYSNPVAMEKQLKFKINLAGNTSQHYFAWGGRYEFEWINIIHKLMPSHDCFIDIGAHFGIYAVTIAQANPSKKVIAVEPLKRNYNLLEENVELNNLSNCTCLLKAASNKKGPLKFYVNPIHDGGGSLRESDIYRTGNIKLDAKKYRGKHPSFTYEQEVESIAVDDLVTNKAVMKIDVEGSELDVLKSATTTFNSGLCDVCVVEVQRDETFLDVLKFMNQLGYDCYEMGNKIPLDGTEKFNWFTLNILCIRRESDHIRQIMSV